MATNDQIDDNTGNSNEECNLEQASKILREYTTPRIDYIFAKQKANEAVNIDTLTTVGIERDGATQSAGVSKKGAWKKTTADHGIATNDGDLKPVSEYEWSMKPRSAVLNLYSEVRSANEPVNYVGPTPRSRSIDVCLLTGGFSIRTCVSGGMLDASNSK